LLSTDDVKNMILLGESDAVELKRELPPDHAVASLISAFANAAGGTLIVGADGRTVIGLSESEAETTFRRVGQITRSIMPERSTYEFGREKIGGRDVVYLHINPVPPELRPVFTSRGQAFIREAGREVPLKFSTGGHAAATTELTVFVAMSFREEEEPSLVDYWNAIRRAAKATTLPIDVTRIDLKEGDYEISQEIMNEIARADVVLVDFTLNSRNVYFELGYARGKGKRVLQTARKGTALEFDVRNWRTLLYRNATELEEKLGAALGEAYDAVMDPATKSGA
jgi:nucleoside 2-deoxyribosyltransferase